MLQKIKKNLDVIVYVILPLILLTITIFFPEYSLFKQYGELAWQLLILVLFIKPIILILGVKQLMPLLTFRREIGIATFWFAIFHAGNMIYNLKMYQLKDYLGWNNFVFWGALAIIAYLIVSATSNNLAMRKLKRNWKKIQSLSYFIFSAVLIHIALIEKEEAWGFIALFLAYWILKILEWKKFKLSNFVLQFINKDEKTNQNS
ncbi:ferric reductase-like transmembrane domain-containing protein [Candidatus Nomurabacteria bacterium]|nr:ferric reductase-like transmembrane domain-containing protein [Candidatus Nomurabacteria bacterium]